jgi:hypothetical protein
MYSRYSIIEGLSFSFFSFTNLLLYFVNLEHLRQIQSNGLNQSIESLSMIMPAIVHELLEDQDEDEDKYAVENRKWLTIFIFKNYPKCKLVLTDQQNTFGDNNIMIKNNNRNINQMLMIMCNQKRLHSGVKRDQISNSITLSWKYLLLFILLLIIGYRILMFFSVKNTIDIGQLKTSNNRFIGRIGQLEISNNRFIEMIQQLLGKRGNYYSHAASQVTCQLHKPRLTQS